MPRSLEPEGRPGRARGKARKARMTVRPPTFPKLGPDSPEIGLLTFPKSGPDYPKIGPLTFLESGPDVPNGLVMAW